MKRGSNEGTIYKDSCRDRWVACLHVGYDDETGKRIRKYRYGKTRAEAKDKLKLLAAQFANTIYHDIDKITVGTWIQKWYDIYAKGRIKQNTCTSYKQMIKKINSYLGKIRLAKLQSIEIQSMINSLHTKEQLSRRTCQYALAILKMALTRAVNDGLLVKSPALNITLPAQKSKEHYFLTSIDWEKLINAYTSTLGGRELMLIEFATGLRQCELLGLQWANFDEKNHTITVTHSLIMDDNKIPILSPTKTAKSQRLLSIPPFVVKSLKAYRKEQAAKILSSPSWTNKNMIFTNEQGDYIKPASFSSRFKKIAKSLNIPTTFHNLRHDFASRMLNSDFDVKVIQEVLGHSTISTTLDIYAHLLHEKKQKVADWLEASSKTLTNL